MGGGWSKTDSLPCADHERNLQQEREADGAEAGAGAEGDAEDQVAYFLARCSLPSREAPLRYALQCSPYSAFLVCSRFRAMLLRRYGKPTVFCAEDGRYHVSPGIFACHEGT